MKSRNKTMLLVSIIFLGVAASAFIIGGIIASWDFKSFLTSSTAYAIYIILGMYVLFVVFLFLKDLINKI